MRLADGEDPSLRREILKRFRQDCAPRETENSRESRRRTVAQLLGLRDVREKERKRRLAEQEAKKQARLAKARAAAREKHLDSLAGREEELWARAEALIQTKLPTQYDVAVSLLVDLRDLSSRQGTSDDFLPRFQRLQRSRRQGGPVRSVSHRLADETSSRKIGRV